MNEIHEIMEMGKRLDELTCEVYSHFAKREDFDPAVVELWANMAEWKKGHAKHWRKISKALVYKNIFKRKSAELITITKQMKNIQAELVEFLRRLRKKKVSQAEAISQTVLNEFWLVSDIFIEIFYLYGQSLPERSVSMVDDCLSYLTAMTRTLRPYLKLNPLYSALMKSMGEINETHDFLVHHFGKKRKTAV